MEKFSININRNAIPEEFVKRVRDAEYVNLDIAPLKQPDERGNTHYVSVFVPKELRNKYPDKIFIGRGRVFKDEERRVAYNTPESKVLPKPDDLPEDNETGLPF